MGGCWDYSECFSLKDSLEVVDGEQFFFMFNTSFIY